MTANPKLRGAARNGVVQAGECAQFGRIASHFQIAGRRSVCREYVVLFCVSGVTKKVTILLING